MASLQTRTGVVASIVIGALLAIVFAWTRGGQDRQAEVALQSAGSPQAAASGGAAKPSGTNVKTRTKPEPTGAITPAEWERRLRGATDYFEFVSEAAVAALAGDGRAALLVSEILPRCQLFRLQYAKAADPKAAFEDYLATLSGRTAAGDEYQRKEFDRCRRFLTDDPLQRMQLGAEGSTSPFWRRLAERNNDPLARSEHALTLGARTTSNDPAGLLDEVRSDLAVVIPSKDADALFNAGKLLVDARLSKDPLRGVAWMIVAVEAGYDGPHLNFPLCGESGPCPSAADFIATLQRDIGMERYARADAQAQEIKDLMAREDWAGLERYWMPDLPSR